MPLSPAEVHNVAFRKPPIGKRGYDEEEVDAFLDIVEAELARLIEENNDLRGQLGGAPPRAEVAAAEAAESKSATDLAAAHQEVERLQAQVAELEQALAGDREQLAGAQQESGEPSDPGAGAGASAGAGAGAGVAASGQSLRLLELAQQTAEQYLAEARAEADRLLSETRTSTQAQLAEAQQTSQAQLAHAQQSAQAQLSDAAEQSERLERESATKAQQTVQEAEQRSAAITAQFEQRKVALERRVEELRTFEREYRSRLKSYLESQLRDLDASGRSEPANAPSDNGTTAEASR